MNLRSVDLNLLVALDALLAERNVSRAAERLSLGQPATSAALRRLRRLFADPLLVRSGQTMELTPLARSLTGPLRTILVGVDDLLSAQPNFNPGRDQRSFTVIASDYVALILLRPLLARLGRQAPNVRVSVFPVTTRLHEMLGRGEVDLVLFPVEVDPGLRTFSHRELFRDRYICAVWDRHPEVGDEVTLEMLSRLPYLSYSPDVLVSYVEAQLDAAGVERNVEISTQTLVLSPLLIRGTRLVAMLHERLARELQQAGELRILEPPLPLKPITEVMFWHPRFDEDPGHVWLRDQVAELAASI